MIALIFLYSTIAAAPSSIINSISTTAYASTIAVPSEQQGSLNLSNNEGDSISPVMAASGNNNVYVAWVDDTRGYKAVFLAKSLDGGIAFGNATLLSNSNNSRNSSFPEEPQIAASGNNVYIAWYDNITGNYEPFLVVSTDNGTSFSNPISLKEKVGVQNKDASDEYGLLASFSQIAASGNNLYVIWYDNITGSVETFLTKSTDNGISFSDPINLSQKAKVGTTKNIAVSGNNVYVLWAVREDEDNNTSTAASPLTTNTQFLLVKSTEGGTTFSQPVIVTNEGGFLGGGLAASGNNNNVYVAWKDDTLSETTAEGFMRVLSNKISLAKSTDGGTTFSKPVNIIESKSSIGSDFNIAANANNVYAVWSMDVGAGEFIPELGRLPGEHIFAAKSTDGGTTFNKPPIDVGNGRFPEVSVSDDNNNLYVTWLYNIGNAEIFFTKITGNLSSQLTDTASLGTTETNATDAASTLAVEEPKEEGAFLTYENPNYGIKIQYPSSWVKIEEQEGGGELGSTATTPVLVSFFSPAKSPTDEHPESVNIVVEVLPSQTFTLDEYTQSGINELRTSLQDVNIIESTDNTTLAGNPAHKIIYTFTFIDKDNPSNQLSIKNMQIWTVKNGKAYVFSYGGVVSEFSESLADAQKMIDSSEISSLLPTITGRGSIG